MNCRKAEERDETILTEVTASASSVLSRWQLKFEIDLCESNQYSTFQTKLLDAQLYFPLTGGFIFTSA